jgi:ABC-2 type transport system permease protein
MRLFLVGGAISYRALFGFLHPAVFVPTLLVVPVFQVILFAYIGRSAGVESDEFFVVGNALHTVALPCIWAMVQAVAGERWQNTLLYILGSPARRAPLFLGRAVPVVLNGLLVSLFALIVGGAVLGITFGAATLASLGVVIAVTAFACTGLGLVLAGLGLVVREISVLNNLLFGFLLVFSGANVPLDALPRAIETLSHGLPLRHGIEAARAVAAGDTLAGAADLLVAEAAVGVVYVVVGFTLIRVFESMSRRRATLEVS